MGTIEFVWVYVCDCEGEPESVLGDAVCDALPDSDALPDIVCDRVLELDAVAEIVWLGDADSVADAEGEPEALRVSEGVGLGVVEAVRLEDGVDDAL